MALIGFLARAKFRASLGSSVGFRVSDLGFPETPYTWVLGLLGFRV